jgi:Spy/CpxP family protein refolding chaperone
MPRTSKRNGMTVAALTLALAALGGAAHAQDQPRPDDQSRHEDQGQRGDHAHDQDQGRHDNNDHGRNDQGGDANRYRKQHPHAAARCHDGFFTNTSDRGRACTKHGGIDVWLRD